MITLNIDDIIEIKYDDDYKLYKLYDIAIWKIDKSVKAIKINQVEVPFEYPVRTEDYRKKQEKRLRNKAKCVFSHGDRFIIKPYRLLPEKNKSAIYEIHVRPRWGNKELIGGVGFQKMMTT